MTTGPTVRRRSRVETELPADLREQANRLILEGMTYEELSDWSASKGHDISRSAWGRYGKRYYEAYQQVRQFEDQSKALASSPGEGLTMEEALSKLLLQKAMAAVLSGEWDVMEAPRLISEIARLQTSSVGREKLKRDLADRARAAAEKVEKIVTRGGLTGDTVSEIKRQILGVAQ